MTTLRILLARIKAYTSRSRSENDLSEEIDFHLAMAARDAERAGLDPEAARFAALRKFGGVDQAKEQYRDTRGLPFLETVAQDLRHGARNWRRTPGVWAAAVLALALGIGATTTIFTTVRAIAVRPLAALDVDTTVHISAINAKSGARRERLSMDEFLALSRDPAATSSPVAVSVVGRILRGVGEPENVAVARVSTDFFDFSRSKPLLGRYPTPQESFPGASPVAVLSYTAWTTRFASDPSAVGRSIRLDDTTYTIIGVSPEETWFPTRKIQVWIPLRLEPGSERTLLVLAARKPGATLDDAQRACDAATAAARSLDPQLYANWSLKARTLYEGMFQPNDRTLIVVLYILSAGVLLIACANVANLLLARSLGRLREQAVRLSMGATRARLIRQSLTEALLLAIPAGLLGLASTHWTAYILIHSFNTDVKLPTHLIDQEIVRFTLFLALGSVFLFAAIPAMLSGKFDLLTSLKQGERGGTSRSRHCFRRSFVVAQTCLALALVGAAVMTAKGVHKLHTVAIGYNVRNLISVRLDPPANVDPLTHVQRALEAVQAAPGIQHTSVLDQMPHVDGNGRPTTFIPDHQPELRPQGRPTATYYLALPGALETLRLPLLSGRDFSPRDEANAPPVVLINRTAADQLWPTADPVGRRIRIDALANTWHTIIGITADVRRANITEPVRPQLFVPWKQHPSRAAFAIAARTDGSETASASLRRVIRTIAPDQPLTLRIIHREIYDDLKGGRVVTTLFTIFAALALFLAAIGLWSVATQSARERTHEVGVRLALGAPPATVTRLLLTESVRLTAIGVAIGSLGLLGIGFTLGPMLLQPVADPFTYAGAAAILATVALLACAMPARAAARADLTRILRTD